MTIELTLAKNEKGWGPTDSVRARASVLVLRSCSPGIASPCRWAGPPDWCSINREGAPPFRVCCGGGNSQRPWVPRVSRPFETWASKAIPPAHASLSLIFTY